MKVEVVAKFSARCDRKATALAMEAIAAMLAADLDLPVPEPFVVAVDNEFVSSVRDETASKVIRESDSFAFGSRHLPPGYTTWPIGKSIPRDAMETAANIFAFDALIANDDRRPENPNCLFNGSALAIFDHEMAFFTKGIIGWEEPWQNGALDHLRTPGRHIFADQLRGKSVKFDRLAGAWLAITDSRLEAYWQALPDSWDVPSGEAERALMYVGLLRDNIEQALSEVRRVLS